MGGRCRMNEIMSADLDELLLLCPRSVEVLEEFGVDPGVFAGSGLRLDEIVEALGFSSEEEWSLFTDLTEAVREGGAGPACRENRPFTEDPPR
jgi:hypothetical protein